MEELLRDVVSTSARLEENCFEALGVQMDLSDYALACHQPPHLLLFISRCLTSLPLPYPSPLPPFVLFARPPLSYRQILLPSCHKSEEEISEGTTLITPNDPVVIKGVPEPPPTPPTPPTSLHLLVPLPYLALLNPALASAIAEKGRAKGMRFVFRVLFFLAFTSWKPAKERYNYPLRLREKGNACIHRVNFHLTGNPSEDRK